MMILSGQNAHQQADRILSSKIEYAVTIEPAVEDVQKNLSPVMISKTELKFYNIFYKLLMQGQTVLTAFDMTLIELKDEASPDNFKIHVKNSLTEL